MKFFHIYDEFIQLRHLRISNRSVCIWLGLIQLLISAAALGQHIYSMVVYHQVLYCDFKHINTSGIEALYLGSDIIIFDAGLFHNLWGINECVANHLDGGYGRFAWCLSHTFALITFLFVALIFKHPRPMFLWPMLIQQSAYGIGLLILSLAALPQLLPLFLGRSASRESIVANDSKVQNDDEVEGALFGPILIYILGAGLNFFLLYVFWHWYWFVEEDNKKRKRKSNANSLLPVCNSSTTSNHTVGSPGMATTRIP